jgi:hypothetical protein
VILKLIIKIISRFFSHPDDGLPVAPPGARIFVMNRLLAAAG